MWGGLSFYVSISFNLNLLECKFTGRTTPFFPVSLLTVLILTYWNVNTFSIKTYDFGGLVLILTYWNVNCTYQPQAEKTTTVLILTYWNVNLNHILKIFCKSSPSFNLNLLECKFITWGKRISQGYKF